MTGWQRLGILLYAIYGLPVLYGLIVTFATVDTRYYAGQMNPQTEHLLNAVMTLGIPPAIIWGLAIGIRWVVRGFRDKK